MCGRFTLLRPPAELAEAFHLDGAPDLPPRYNVAPTQPVLTLRAGPGGPEWALMRWGLVPSWSADDKGAAKLINARAETAPRKPAFRAAFKARRCVAPADGFYEWVQVGRKRQPHYFTLRDGRVFTFAGLWEAWEGDGQHLETFSILTTEANEVVRFAHDRMPVILPKGAEGAWLDRGPEELLRPYPAGEMACRAVSDFVNSARNEGPGCLGPAGPAQRSLF